MAHNRSGWADIHGRRAHSVAVVIALVALAVCLAVGSALGCGSSSAEQTGNTSARTWTESSSSTIAKASNTTEAGRGPELSTDLADDSATATLQEEYEDLLDESRAIRSALQASGRNGEGDRLPELSWPIAGEHVVTSAFGPRFHPVLKRDIDHEGCDLAAATSTQILAAAAGKVLYVGNMGGHGKTIIVEHGSGLATVYCHLSHILVDNGELVTRGEIIARSGSTGLATGPHLHFEVRVNGTPKDPTLFLPQR
jgi:murein DD-endopeptidase MepM/ murein hydrolase activator NlpD